MSKSITGANQKTSRFYHRPRIISIHTFKILFYLIKWEDSAYNSEIKTYLNRSSSQVSQIMRRLIEKNYLYIESSRPLKYAITELGRKVYKQTIKDFLRFQDKRRDIRQRKNINKSVIYEAREDIENEKYTEIKEYYEDILISFFIELPEMLVDLNINFTPEKYHRFVEETKTHLLKYDIMLWKFNNSCQKSPFMHFRLEKFQLEISKTYSDDKQDVY